MDGKILIGTAAAIVSAAAGIAVSSRIAKGLKKKPAPEQTSDDAAAELNIVLVEPQIPPNTGNISRTCAVTGAKLHLVEPLGFEITDKTLKRAGLDYWDKLDIFYYKGLDDFFAKNEGEFYFFTTKGRKTHSQVAYPKGKRVYIVFGREDKGLPEELLYANPEKCIRIPMRNDLRSLNLSNSVAIAAYEVLRQWDYPDLGREGKLTKYTWQDQP